MFPKEDFWAPYYSHSDISLFPLHTCSMQSFQIHTQQLKESLVAYWTRLWLRTLQGHRFAAVLAHEIYNCIRNTTRFLINRKHTLIYSLWSSVKTRVIITAKLLYNHTPESHLNKSNMFSIGVQASVTHKGPSLRRSSRSQWASPSSFLKLHFLLVQPDSSVLNPSYNIAAKDICQGDTSDFWKGCCPRHFVAGQKWDYKRVRLESLAKAAQLKLRGSHLPSDSFQLQRNFRVGDSPGKKLFAYMLLLLISLFLNVSVFRPLSERCVRGKAPRCF